MRIGILALQGCVEPHKRHLRACFAEPVEVRTKHDLENIDGLIIPGGESTTLLKLIQIFELEDALLDAAKRIPFWGICAGSIVMAKNVFHPAQHSLGLIDLDVERNSYGRQRESFTTRLNEESGGYEVAFIRAPRFLRLGPSVRLLESNDGEVVSVEIPGSHLVTSFHAELNPRLPSPYHSAFVERCEERHARRLFTEAKVVPTRFTAAL